MNEKRKRKPRIPPPPPRERERPVIERVADEPRGGGPGGAAKRRRRSPSSVDVGDVVITGVGGETEGKLRRRLAEAAVAFERERFGEAFRLLQSIERLAPDIPEVLELRGLTQYRQGRWAQAIKDLRRFEELTNSVEQHPVIADCHRARREWREVEACWQELGEASPSAELVEEGRIVMAGAYADQGELNQAIRLLEQAPQAAKRPKPHHLRRFYALADLYERAGDLKRARRLFEVIEQAEPGIGDVSDRIRQLR